MNKTFFKICLGVLAVAGVVWPSRGEVTGMKTLSGHVPSITSKLTPLSRLDATNQLRLAIGLPLRNQTALTNLLRELYDHTSPNFRHFITPDEFTAQFGPSESDYQTVLDFARSNNLTIERVHPGRTLVDVLAPISNIERAFNVKMMTYHHPVDARDFYAPDKEPTVSDSLPILAIQGLNNYVLPRAMMHSRPIPSVKAASGTGPNGEYMGSDFRNAYVPGSSLNGANQTIGLLQFDGYFASDIAAYENYAGLTNVPLQNVLLDGFNGTPGAGNGEVCLDIEMSVSMAPALAKIVVFEGGPYGLPNDVLSTMASSNQIRQLSSSWGYGVDATSDQFYREFAVQGQTYVNCSGDGDAWVGPILYGSVENANVTVVGGTTLTMNGNGISYASEKAWNAGNVGDYGWNPDGYAGTSGGISSDVPIPYYQEGISMVTNQGSTTLRNVPDIALTADNVFIVADGGYEEDASGTSAATPLWAGFMALVNQQAVAQGVAPVGFLAPAVYDIAKSSAYASCFHDTVNGDNTWDQSPDKYLAVPGYDLCTGLGTPNGTNLINALLETNVIVVIPTPVVPAPTQPWGTMLGVMNGTDPNGLWFLFFQDDVANGYSGTNNNGWQLNLTTASPVGFPADDQIFINSSNVVITPGSQWVMTLAITNYGPSVSSNVYVNDQLPPSDGITLSSWNSSLSGSTVTVQGGTLTWTVGSLPLNAGGTLSLTLVGTSAGTYTNGAIVYSIADPNFDDNTVGALITVAPPTPPSISPRFSTTGNKAFTLSVTNVAGSTVVIQASTNLTTWVPVVTNVAPFTFTNFDNTNFLYRFYRAVITGQ